MRRGILTVAAAGLLTAGSLTACGGDSGGAAAGRPKPKIGVILPDSGSSNRWETADRRYLAAAFNAAGVDYDIQNAQNDKARFVTIAEQMITNGVTALMITNLDSGTGKTVLDKATQKGVATIDYDRPTLGGSAQYYVSFDNVAVGRLQGEGLVRCLTDKGVRNPVVAALNGAPTDNNAAQLKEGYDSVLGPKYAAGGYVKGPDQPVPEWNNTVGGTIFEQMLTQTGGRIDGVLAANDGLANAVISVLAKNKLNGRIPVTGQDADAQALQHILSGDQCMTVYKPIRQQAEAAAALAIALARGERKKVDQVFRDPEGNRDVPAVLLAAHPITREAVKNVIADGYVSKDAVCAGRYAALCDSAGVS
ncbi:sugar ABC transporter substrate-binding protein [Micromonospora olivasterospora]|uniref:Monosaccharide ABC transporter substrate-binding protein, CUT2 family (TC 3.A.1.2.-) n=1 Tax=Micromonospora olivasterospora TaxID=1880 RepID=A0A562I6B9_MICOL|nr:substrate-binding domain-containing protein [Micromonospora olivasterospora]TWH66539.1 monosaccharide ABC transporter substrate-binding protein, CUT2 family (TC 3.A.1.2.-) [Micromonospora olivasterospora]